MRSRLFAFAAGAALCLAGNAALPGAPDDWAEGAPGHNDGANRTYYNAGGQLAWRNPVGDWRDAEGARQEDKPFAVADVAGEARDGPVEWDVTGLARDWAAGKVRNKGVLLRNTTGSGDHAFHSREAERAEARPLLLLVVNGQPRTLTAAADTYLVRSTYRPQGNGTQLRVHGAMPALVRFDLDGLRPADRIDRATLRLVAAGRTTGGEVGVFACDQGEEVEPVDPLPGLAAGYPADRGIERDADVLFATGFEADDWKRQWTSAGGRVETVAAHPKNRFEPLAGKACRALLAEGENTAMNLTYQFRRRNGAEPEEVYFRYYLRFGDDWRPAVDGGKMPGVSGTYGRAGWGGRKVDGRNGWSARGSFRPTLPDGNPLAGKQVMGSYCYHADMPGTYGDIWAWNRGYRGFLDNNRWYCVEQHVRLNTPGTGGGPGARDGVLRAWVDGRPAFERTDLRLRDAGDLKVEQVWMNVYHGGTKPSPRDQHLYVDNVVIAKRYIGPMK